MLLEIWQAALCQKSAPKPWHPIIVLMIATGYHGDRQEASYLQGRFDFFLLFFFLFPRRDGFIASHACSLSVALPFLIVQPRFKGHVCPPLLLSLSFYESHSCNHVFMSFNLLSLLQFAGKEDVCHRSVEQHFHRVLCSC